MRKCDNNDNQCSLYRVSMGFKDKDYKEIGFVISIGLAIVVIVFTMMTRSEYSQTAMK